MLRCATQNARKARSRALLAEIDADRAESLAHLTEEERMERNERDIMQDVEDSITTRCRSMKTQVDPSNAFKRDKTPPK